MALKIVQFPVKMANYPKFKHFEKILLDRENYWPL